MATILGQYDLTASGSPIHTISFSADLLDSAGTYGAGEGEHKQEFRRLPQNAVKAIEDAVRAAVLDAGVNEIRMDLDLDDFGPWDNQIDRIFLNMETGYRASENWALTRDIAAGNVRQWRLTR